MEKRVFEVPVKVRYSEMDYDLGLKPSALMLFLQDLASDNAEQLGFGYSFVREHNLAWFLLKYHMEFDEYPSGTYDLTIKTEPRGYNKLFAFRDFEILSAEKRLGRVASTWALADMDTRSMASVAEVMANKENMKPFEKRDDDLAYGKIRIPEKFDFEKVFEIRFEDIDVNQHANNANYIIWAFEPLGFEFRKSRKLKTLDLMFKKEIKYGSNVLSQVAVADDTTTHVLKNAETGEDLCMICANWIQK